VYLARARLEEADDDATVLLILLIDRSPDRGTIGNGMTDTDRRVEILQNFAKNTIVNKREGQIVADDELN
jgi:hypothetical protein